MQITQRNKFTVGEMIEIMKPDGTNLLVPVKAIYDEEGNSVESAPPSAAEAVCRSWR